MSGSEDVFTIASTSSSLYRRRQPLSPTPLPDYRWSRHSIPASGGMWDITEYETGRDGDGRRAFDVDVNNWREGQYRDSCARRRLHSPLGMLPAPRCPQPPHRRTQSDQVMSDRTDAILQRSVEALEASTALLHSSLLNRDSLSRSFFGSEPLQSDFRIDSLSRRFAASDLVDANMEDLLQSTEELVPSWRRGWAPALQLSTDRMEIRTAHSRKSSETNDDLPHLSPLRLSSGCITPDYTTTSPPSSSRSHHRYHNSYPCITESALSSPISHSTPAYNLLSSIVIHDSATSKRSTRRGSRCMASTPDFHSHPTNVVSPTRRRGQLVSGPLSSSSDMSHTARAVRRTHSSESIHSPPRSRTRTRELYSKVSLASIISPRFFDRHARSGRDLASHDPVRNEGAVGHPVIAEETRLRLRFILTKYDRSKGKEKVVKVGSGAGASQARPSPEVPVKSTHTITPRTRASASPKVDHRRVFSAPARASLSHSIRESSFSSGWSDF
jgi:hypothetical protein